MAVDASVTVYKSGSRTILGKRLLLRDTTGYHSRLHFGLAKHEQVDIEVRFPTKKEIVRVPAVRANRYVVLRPSGGVTDVVLGGQQ